jgi:uncharacterized protein (TIGR02452 family)
MIKRNGVEIMNARTKNVSIAKETLDILKQGFYQNPNGENISIVESLKAAIEGSVLYQNPLDQMEATYFSPTIEVTNETTAQAAQRLLKDGKDNVVALNFAAARNPGGGFMGGALAQEEDLCRCSGLYYCLKSKPIFYNENIVSPDTFYTDNIIYSPRVPFFRDLNNSLLEIPFELSIITAPAPNLIGLNKEELTDQIQSTLQRRALKLLQIAQLHQHTHLILGAWGCGAFCNDAPVVAKIFDWALKIVSAFQHITFAVYDLRAPPVVLEAFQKQFS